MKYQVKITETFSSLREVEANSEAKAVEIIEDKCNRGVIDIEEDFAKEDVHFDRQVEVVK